MTNTRTDLSGKTFGRLTAIKDVGKNIHGRRMWLCNCSCGNQKILEGASLTSGNVKSCGCLPRKIRKNLVGTRFGRLTVISCNQEKGKRLTYNCQCDCGEVIVIDPGFLVQGSVKSCGCLRREGSNIASAIAGKIKLGSLRRSMLVHKEQRFGWWTIKSDEGIKEGGTYKYLCECRCGEVKLVNIYHILKGRSTSCGCRRTVKGRRLAIVATTRKCGVIRHINPAGIALNRTIRYRPQRNESGYQK